MTSRAAVVFALVLCGIMATVLARLPAGLVDAGVRQLSDGRLRIAQAQGSVWRGTGVLALVDAGGRLRAARHLDWRTQWVGYRLALRFLLAEQGQPQLVLMLSPSGMSIEKLTLELPLELLTAAVDHPAARAGWQGGVRIDSNGLACDFRLQCAGQVIIEWHDTRVSLLPGYRLGAHRALLTANGPTVELAVHTLEGDTRIEGLGTLVDGRVQALDLLFTGPPDLVGRLPNVLDGHARPTATPGQVRLRYP